MLGAVFLCQHHCSLLQDMRNRYCFSGKFIIVYNVKLNILGGLGWIELINLIQPTRKQQIFKLQSAIWTVLGIYIVEIIRP